MHRYIAPILSLPRTRPLHRVLHIPPDRAIACGQQIPGRPAAGDVVVEWPVAKGGTLYGTRRSFVVAAESKITQARCPVCSALPLIREGNPGPEEQQAHTSPLCPSLGRNSAHETMVPEPWLGCSFATGSDRRGGGRPRLAAPIEERRPVRPCAVRCAGASTPQCRAAWRMALARRTRGCSDRPAARQRLARNAASVLYLRRRPTGPPTKLQLAAPATRPSRRPIRA